MSTLPDSGAVVVESASRRPRRWRRFSLKGIFLLTAMVAVALVPAVFHARRVYREREVIKTIEAHYYDQGKTFSLFPTPSSVSQPGVGPRLVRGPAGQPPPVVYETSRTDAVTQKLYGNFYGDDFFRRATEVAYNIYAEDVNRTGVQLRGPTDNDLAPLTQLLYLKSMTVCGPLVTGRGLAHLASLPRLKILRLESTSLHAADFKPLRDAPVLEDLTIFGQRIEAEDTAALAQLAGLRHLALVDTGVMDEALAPLGQMRRLESLVLNRTPERDVRGRIFLDSNRRMALFGDAGLAHLAPLAELRRLELHGADVGDASIEVLARMTCLEILSIRKTKITRAGLARLKAALPKCQIIFDPRASANPTP